jgi:ANTAR domain/Nitrate and nitrite sensing
LKQPTAQPGKEFAGQERAAGSALYASGRAHASEQQRLLHLIESQERCLQVFTDFSSDALGALWIQNQPSTTLAELERMRRVLCTAANGATLDASQSPVWFECCSQRMDRMKVVEDALAQQLLQVCEDKIVAAHHDLQTFTALGASATCEAEALAFFKGTPPAGNAIGLPTPMGGASLTPPPSYGPHLERSILELVQEQARRLQSMGDELDTVRASLNERKLVERAKGLLMAHRQLSEEDAHKTMRQMAMNQNRRLIEVAEAVLAMADVLPARHR